MRKTNQTQTPQTAPITKIEQLLSEIIELQSVKHVTKYSTSANYTGPQKEHYTLPSLTQPDMLLSLQDLLDRFTRGLPVSGRNDGYYDDEYDFSDYDHMDFAERAMAMDELRAEIAHLESLNRSAHESEQDAGAQAQQAAPSGGQLPPNNTPQTDSPSPTNEP